MASCTPGDKRDRDAQSRSTAGLRRYRYRLHRVRSEGSLIRATNGLSNGIVPWLKTLDSSVAAVKPGRKRKGAACGVSGPWACGHRILPGAARQHRDDARRTHHLNLAKLDTGSVHAPREGGWTVVTVDPSTVPQLPDLFGPAFDAAYARRGPGAGPQDDAGTRLVWPG